MGDDLDLALASLLDDNLVLEVANTALNLDLLLEELLEGGGVEDLVARGLLGVDDELCGGEGDVSRSDLSASRAAARSEGGNLLLTFLVVLADLPDFFCNCGEKI